MRRLLVISMLAMLALAACGDDDDGGGLGGGDDADVDDLTDQGGVDVDTCELLSAEEVEAAIGNPVDDGEPDVINGCGWGSDDPDQRSVSVSLIGLPDPELCVDALEGDDTLEEASGFDDPAFISYIAASGGLASVVVCHEQGQFQLIVNGGLSESDNEDELRGAAEDLTQTALDRL